MGHAIGTTFLSAKTKDAAMKEGYKYAESFAFYNVDKRENPSGNYHGWFNYYNEIFNDEEEAMDFFDSLGSYQDGVCQVKEATKSATNKYHNAVTKYREKQNKLKEKALENFKKRTSATVGCKQCGTRFPKSIAEQRRLICSNCGNWMVSDTIKKQWQKYEDGKKFAEETYLKSRAEDGKPKYWCKVEVHC